MEYSLNVFVLCISGYLENKNIAIAQYGRILLCRRKSTLSSSSVVDMLYFRSILLLMLLLLFCYSFLHSIHRAVTFKAAGVAEGAANTIPQREVLAVIIVVVHLQTKSIIAVYL